VGTFPGAAKTLNAPVWLMPQKDIALQGSQTNLKRMIEAAASQLGSRSPTGHWGTSH